MKIIIPLAGKDPRFVETPKPLIDIEGKPLIKRCTDSIESLFREAEVLFLILAEDEARHKLAMKLKEFYPGSDVLFIHEPTEGAACTVLLAKEYINNDDELIIYLADIFFDAPLEEAMQRARERNESGIIPCFPSSNPKYSYAIVGDDEYATKVAEKEVISENASSGFYYFLKGKDFVWAAEEMIRKDLRVNGWFYICPVYQQLIERGDNVRVLTSTFRFGLGSPEEIELFRKEREEREEK